MNQSVCIVNAGGEHNGKKHLLCLASVANQAAHCGMEHLPHITRQSVTEPQGPVIFRRKRKLTTRKKTSVTGEYTGNTEVTQVFLQLFKHALLMIKFSSMIILVQR